MPPHLVYPTRPLHDILDTVALDVPDRPATAFLGATLTFHEIKDRSDRLATVLAHMDDMIIVDGFNVYPSEIEAVMHEHPAVQLVVVGMPDAYHGESVRACIVLKEGHAADEAHILEHCRLHLAPYKVPSRIEFRHTLPMSAVGKVLYRVLREETAATTTPAS